MYYYFCLFSKYSYLICISTQTTLQMMRNCFCNNQFEHLKKFGNFFKKLITIGVKCWLYFLVHKSFVYDLHAFCYNSLSLVLRLFTQQPLQNFTYTFIYMFWFSVTDARLDSYPIDVKQHLVMFEKQNSKNFTKQTKKANQKNKGFMAKENSLKTY